jgi:arylsulfatase A-like enzyme
MNARRARRGCAIAMTALFAAQLEPALAAGPAAVRRPNILVVLADDLGYSDIEPFGGEIRTPNLQRLAREGLRLTNFHAQPTCSPTRAILMTGVDNHVVGFGTMRDDETPGQKGRPGYETYLNDRAVTIAELLRDAGYNTLMSGKWDLGVTDDRGPDRRGFVDSFALLQGSADHFEQREAMPGVLPRYRENGRAVSLEPGFYSSKTYTDRMIGYIDRHRGDGRPFFGYLAYTAPHYPLQAGDAYLARYRDAYRDGYAPIQAARVERMRELGILDRGVRVAPQEAAWPAWEDLPGEARALETRRMQVYAAMIEEMDHHFGRLLEYLEEIGELDNTFIVFLSDNGADGSNPLDWGWEEWAAATRDLRVENMGRPGSYVWQGPGWASVSSTPFRLFKFFTTEGGTRSPTIIRHPRKVEAGRVSSAFASVLDLAPTLLDVAGVAMPGSNYRGRPTHPMQGATLLPVLSGEAGAVHDADAAFGTEMYNRRSLRQGDWKIVWINAPWGRGLGQWSLFNLADDPTELDDLADREPARLAQLIRLWDDYVRANGVIAVDDFVPAATNRFTHYDWRPPAPPPPDATLPAP